MDAQISFRCGRYIGCLSSVLALLLTGCGGVGSSPAESPRPAIDDRSSALRQPGTALRTVVAGDTLYSIAWETGRDYRTLAAWNRIPSPYTIKIGQQIRVIPPDGKGVAPENQKNSYEQNNGASVKPDAQRKAPVSPKTTNSKKMPSPRATASAGAAGNAPTPVDGLGAKGRATRKSSASNKNEPTLNWSWPADGTLLNRAGSGEPRGLDIGGSRGSVIRAAANGRVVYQGSGLRGYGQLIIIKHSDEFLSAYAHNDRIYVKEGDLVKRGEKIADMGSSGTDRPKLHFEIRRQGVPADPLAYLPKR